MDEEIYIISGILRVTPFVIRLYSFGFLLFCYHPLRLLEFDQEYDESMVFEAGDYVRFPKWLVTKHDYDGEYKQKYRFIPYGEQ